MTAAQGPCINFTLLLTAAVANAAAVSGYFTPWMKAILELAFLWRVVGFFTIDYCCLVVSYLTYCDYFLGSYDVKKSKLLICDRERVCTVFFFSVRVVLLPPPSAATCCRDSRETDRVPPFSGYALTKNLAVFDFVRARRGLLLP